VYWLLGVVSCVVVFFGVYFWDIPAACTCISKLSISPVPIINNLLLYPLVLHRILGIPQTRARYERYTRYKYNTRQHDTTHTAL